MYKPTYDPAKHHRRSVRLKGYDYAQAGAYFVTICTHERSCVFGSVVGGDMLLNDAGRMAAAAWRNLPERFGDLRLDRFVVMPNHVHGILWFAPPYDPYVGAKGSVGLGQVIGAYKSATTVAYLRSGRSACGRLWQRSFYDHVIRDEDAFGKICAYIDANPALWPYDRENPERIQPLQRDVL